jgi:hypothetical protein
MHLPAWDTLESISRAASWIAIATLICWGLLVTSEILARFWERRKRLLDALALVFFALAVVGEVLNYKYAERKEFLHGRALADAINQAANRTSTPEGIPHLIKVENKAPGNFAYPHRLGCTPSAVLVQMTSLGFIALQAPKSWDDTNVYLTASDEGLKADILIWCKPK